MCVISLWDQRLPMGLIRHPQSHCALPLLSPVNQSEPSVFVMVEDNQFQNKKKGREKAGQWGGPGGGGKNRTKGKEALRVPNECPPPSVSETFLSHLDSELHCDILVCYAKFGKRLTPLPRSVNNPPPNFCTCKL